MNKNFSNFVSVPNAIQSYTLSNEIKGKFTLYLQINPEKRL